MTTYLLSAAGVIFLSVIVSLLIPEGKLNKTIVFVMRLCCILVMLKPISGIFKFSSAETSGDYFDYAFVSKQYSDNQSEQLSAALSEKYGKDIDCTVTVTYSDGEFSAVAVTAEVNCTDEKILDEVYAYLDGLGYINITVYAKSA